MKVYTDLKQSKRLAEILPIGSADMFWANGERPAVWNNKDISLDEMDTPAWSLAALLEIIRNNGRYELQMWEGGYYFEANGFMTESYFNAVDACVEMIIRLHKEKLI